MRYEVKGDPFPVVICTLDDCETVCCQKGAMAWMTPNMEMSTNAGGSIGKMLSRAVSRESIFQNKYTAKGTGEIAFAPTVPGQIITVEISPERSIVAQKSAFLASGDMVNFNLFFQKKFGAGLVGGEGFILQQFTGYGPLFLEIGGSVVEYELSPGESILVDTGYLAAMDATCSIDIESVKGVGNALFGGEGLFNTRVTGPGHVWLQTMPTTTLAANLSKYMVSK